MKLTQKEVYELIYKTCLKELIEVHTEDKASRLSNKFAVKNTWNAYLTQPK